MNAAKIGHQRAPKFDVERTSRNLSGTTNYLTVAAEREGLRAKKSIYYFDGLAVSWRGWDGEKNFHSLEGGIRLSAKHDGHVRLRLELEDFDRPDTWTIKAEVTLDPG
ncbi:hypothetical protein MB46_06925 [Arthrobacter alpinus]|uniref:DUF6228 family protein n=1 Tax=Arthrobacter alpinus TaxID=656366 RepID=UPI0005C7FE87|nr:hypothetical protein MB46_06925 [Arthrobacter alpinus]